MKINNDEVVNKLIKRLIIEYEKKDKSGVYGQTQKMLAFNSNRIEGNALTYNQTSSIFDTGTLLPEEEQEIYYNLIKEFL